MFKDRKKVDTLWKMAGLQAWQSIPEDVMKAHAEQTGTIPVPTFTNDGTPNRLVRALRQSPNPQTVGTLVTTSIADIDANPRIGGMEQGILKMQIAMFLGAAYGELIDRSRVDEAMQSGRDALFASNN